MKRAEMMGITEKLLLKGNLRSDRRGHLYEYLSDRGVWRRIERQQSLRTIITHVRELGVEIIVAEAEIIYHEISVSPDFWEEKLDSDGTTEYVVCDNGRLNLTTGELGVYDKTAYDRIHLDFCYKKDAKITSDSAWGRYLGTSLGIVDLVPATSVKFRRLLQVIGYALSNLFGAKKAFILLGPPNSGKSVLLNFLGRIIGEANWRPLSLSDITDKYRAGELDGARLVLSHEVRVGSLKKLDIVKSVISGDPIMIEAKGVQPWLFTPRVIILMAANSLPELGEVDAGGAFVDRLMVIIFKQLTGAKNSKLIDALYQERDDFLSVVFNETADLIRNDFRFPEDKAADKILAEYRQNSNSLTAFLTDKYEIVSEKAVSTVRLYEEYRKYCRDNFLTECSSKQFRAQLTVLGYKLGKKRIGGNLNPIACVLNIQEKQTPRQPIQERADGSIDLLP